LADRIFGAEFSLSQYYFSEIVVNWFRRRHAQFSHDKLMSSLNANVEKDNIPSHMRIAVAQINLCHGKNWSDILKMKRRQNGFRRDYIHPRFVAALLRLGDLLDLDSTRFNPYQLEYLSSISRDSAAHLLKNLAISEFLINERTICITTDFNTDMSRKLLERHLIKEPGANWNSIDDRLKSLISTSAKIMRDWMKMIGDDAKEFRIHWNDVAPDNMKGSIAVLEKSMIRIDHVEQGENDFDLRYRISSKRSSQIIEGVGLYDNENVTFLRELIQNAQDGTKRQIYRNMLAQNIAKPDKLASFTDCFYYMPDYFNHDPKMKRAFSVKVNIFRRTKGQVFCDENEIQNNAYEFVIQIIDSGIGITRKRLEKMKNIGAINDPEMQGELNNMPEWLRPTGDFGIGMQSVFLIADNFTVKSRPRELEDGRTMQRRVIFNSARLGGDITHFEEEAKPINGNETWNEQYDVINGNKTYYPYGTLVEIAIDLTKPSRFLRRLFPETTSYAEAENTLPLNVPYMLAALFMNYLDEYITSDIVPIEVCLDKDIWPHDQYRLFPAISMPIAPRSPRWDSKNKSTPDSYLWFNKYNDKNAIYFWYDKEYSFEPHNNKSRRGRFCVLLCYVQNDLERFYTSSFFYRGIRFREYTGAKDNSIMKLSDLVGIPGYSCVVNIMCQRAGDVIEINRDRIKSGYSTELYTLFAECFRAFLDNMLNEFGNNNRSSYMLSERLYDLLSFYYLTIGKQLEMHRYDSLWNRLTGYSECVLFDFSDPLKYYAIMTKRSTQTLLKMIESGKLWFVDYQDEERYNEVELIPSEHYPHVFSDMIFTAARNSFSILWHQRYERIVAFQREGVGEAPLLVYRIASGDSGLPEIDRYSFYLIVKYIIYKSIKRSINNNTKDHSKNRNIQYSEVDNQYFPTFPAFRGLANKNDWISVLSIDVIPSNASQYEINRYNRWIVSPFTIGEWQLIFEKPSRAKQIINELYGNKVSHNSCDDIENKCCENQEYRRYALYRFIILNSSFERSERLIREYLQYFAEYLVDLFIRYDIGFTSTESEGEIKI